jgi:hypothetical protein
MRKILLAMSLLSALNLSANDKKPAKLKTIIYQKNLAKMTIRIDDELWKFKFTNKEYDNEQLVEMSMKNEERKRTYRYHSTFKNLHIAVEDIELKFSQEEVFLMYWFKYEDSFSDIVKKFISYQYPTLKEDRLNALIQPTMDYLQLFID